MLSHGATPRPSLASNRLSISTLHHAGPPDARPGGVHRGVIGDVEELIERTKTVVIGTDAIGGGNSIFIRTLRNEVSIEFPFLLTSQPSQ